MIAVPVAYMVLKDNLEAATLHDEATIAYLYQSYFESVYHFLKRRVGDEQLAEDLSSEVFIKLIKALRGNAAPHSSLRAWLFRVARNVIYDHYQQRAEFGCEGLEEWLPSTSNMDPEVQAMQSLQLERIRDLICRLAPAQQEVLLLRFDQGLSLQETAAVMGKNVNAIKALQFRAVTLLRGWLEKKGHDTELD